MTPTLEKLRALYQKRAEAGQVLYKNMNDEDVDVRELVKNACSCASCGAFARVLGRLEIETLEEELAVVDILLSFLGGAPLTTKMFFIRALYREMQEGLLGNILTPQATAEINDAFEALQVIEKHETAVSDNDSKDEATTMADKKAVPTETERAVIAVGAMMEQLAGGTAFKNTQVVREGAKIVLPEGMSCRQGVEVLTQQMKEDETVVAVSIDIDAYPLEGARAFHAAISEKFGWVNHVPTPGFFSSNPPTMIDIEVDVGKMEQVMWGRIVIPAIDGFLDTGFTVKDGRFLFSINGKVKKKDKALVEQLGVLTREMLKKSSMYKGKALRINFPDPKDEEFNPGNCPKFVDTSKTKPEQLIYSQEIQEQIETALFNPIECTAVCRQLNISLKRGTLLAGTYGVGKSMAAAVTAHKCVANGWTFLYVDQAKQLPQALRFAKQYAPAVVFVEDVDKVLKGDRDESLDQILNTIDGVDTKNDDIMLVFTTNMLSVINKAALRAKRLDFVIEITPPDAAAVSALVKQYTSGNLAVDEDLTQIGDLLKGQIPATIAEVCSRAQLTAVRRMKLGDKLTLKEHDLIVAGRTMLQQLKLITTEAPKTYGNSVEKGMEILGGHIREIAEVLQTKDDEKHSNGSKKTPSRVTSASS